MEKCISEIMEHGIPKSWCDTLTMQSLYSLEEKGFKKKVVWKQSTVVNGSIGLFADEFIQKGEIYRINTDKKNMIVLNSEKDVPPLTDSTIEYLSNYLFQVEGLCALAIPGSSVNHSLEKNNHTAIRTPDNELVSIATKNIPKGGEILSNYEDWGIPPSWLIDFAKKHDILENMGFKDYNDYV